MNHSYSEIRMSRMFHGPQYLPITMRELIKRAPNHAASLSLVAGRVGGRRMGVSAPGGTVQGRHLEGQKYGILKCVRFWRIFVCIAGQIQRVR